MLIHYGQLADGSEQYTDNVDSLDCEIVRYATFDADWVEEVVKVARLNAARFGTAFSVSVGDVYVERAPGEVF